MVHEVQRKLIKETKVAMYIYQSLISYIVFIANNISQKQDATLKNYHQDASWVMLCAQDQEEVGLNTSIRVYKSNTLFDVSNFIQM